MRRATSPRRTTGARLIPSPALASPRFIAARSPSMTGQHDASRTRACGPGPVDARGAPVRRSPRLPPFAAMSARTAGSERNVTGSGGGPPSSASSTRGASTRVLHCREGALCVGYAFWNGSTRRRDWQLDGAPFRVTSFDGSNMRAHIGLLLAVLGYAATAGCGSRSLAGGSGRVAGRGGGADAHGGDTGTKPHVRRWMPTAAMPSRRVAWCRGDGAAGGVAGASGGTGGAAGVHDGGADLVPADAGAPGLVDARDSATADAVIAVHGWVNRTPDLLPTEWPSGRRDPAPWSYDRQQPPGRRSTAGTLRASSPAGHLGNGTERTGQWTRRSGPTPPSTCSALLAATYDDYDRGVVIFGGVTFPSADPSNELWRRTADALGWVLAVPSTPGASWPARADERAGRLRRRGRAPGSCWSGAIHPRLREWGRRRSRVAGSNDAVGTPTNSLGAFAWDERSNRGVLQRGDLRQYDLGVERRRRHVERCATFLYPGSACAEEVGLRGLHDSGRGPPSCSAAVAHPNSWTNEMWEWDGTSWTLLDVGDLPGAPEPRGGQGLAYDSDRHCLVVFGGAT